MFTNLPPLPPTGEEVMSWDWPRIAPYYDDLLARSLTAENVAEWLSEWTAIAERLDEADMRFTIATTVNTADEEVARRFRTFVDEVQPQITAAEQRVRSKLLASGLQPLGFEVPLRKLASDVALFREENLPLLAKHRKQILEFEELAGARMVDWEGERIPLLQLYPVLEEPNRARRETAWRTAMARLLEDTPALADLWRRMVTTRGHIARNASCGSYRDYRWRQLHRFDYNPADALSFHAAIEEVAVPAAQRINERRREQLGVATLRPWDLDVDPAGRPPLRPYRTIAELEEGASRIFRQVDPRFAEYFETMRAERLLDLDSRANKAPGGYSLKLNTIRRPFIFTNLTASASTHGDIQLLLHESGHAFHAFEAAHLPYLQQRPEGMRPIEFAEVASTGMELLASPYLTRDQGGIYTEQEAARAQLSYLQAIIDFWPYMAMIDALQHWAYEHEDRAVDIERCDDQWEQLLDRFWPHVDWSGLEREQRTYWHRQRHVFADPFYYIEYGLAYLGTVQLWANARRDQREAVAAYRRALALGATVPVPDLYAAAGVRFAFDAAILREAVGLCEQVIAELEPVAGA